MRKSRLYKFFIILLMTAFGCIAQAQNFNYKAILGSIKHDGFYTVALTPAIVADCKPNLEDLRLKDEAGKEAPYILQRKPPELLAANIIDLPLHKTAENKKVIIQNTFSGGINELLLFIKNTEANRIATLSGSDDSSHWFVIKEKFLLSKNDSTDNKESFNQTLNFPYSKYHFFQIEIEGKDSLPVDIFKAGIYKKSVVINISFDTVPQPIILQKDSSDKQSYTALQFDNFYQINKLNFLLSGSKFFNRSFVLYDDRTGYKTELASGNVTSANNNTEVDCSIKTNRLLLVINNQDNAPLKVNAAAAFQLPVALIAYLDSGKQYSLFFADSALQAPVYDLQYFSDSIHNNISLLFIVNTEKINNKAVKTAANNGRNQWLLWCIIIVVLLLLIYFSYAILKDIKQKTNNNVHL